MASKTPERSPAPPPKHPNFFRLLGRNASSQKHGLAVVVLATSCLFLSMSMLDHKRRFEQLQDHYLSLKSENKSLKETLATVTDIVFQDSQVPAATDSSASPSAGVSPSTEGSGFMV